MRLGLVAALVLALGSLAGPVRAQTDEMVFQVVNLADGRQVIQAVGAITPRTASDFTNFMRSVDSIRVKPIVLLHSPGGSLGGGMSLGTALRRAGATIVVARSPRIGADWVERLRERSPDRANIVPRGRIAAGHWRGLEAGACLSACVIAMMAAERRFVPEPSVVGVHRAAYRGSAQDIEPADVDARAGAMMRRWATLTGVSPALIDLAQSIPHAKMRILTPAEMRRFRLLRER